MRLLLTNDDGIDSPGLRELFESVKGLGEIFIVAPANQRSGFGASITFSKPVATKQIPWEGAKAWSVDGTPTDCVKAALSIFMKEARPDFVLAGVNHGANSGRNILYSGTIGCAIEAVLQNIPGIAFSYVHECNASFHDVKPVIPQIVDHFITHPIASGTLINVNIPHHPLPNLKGLRMARQGQSLWLEDPVAHADDHYHLKGTWTPHPEHPDSDIALLAEGYVTAVPIHINELTDHTTLLAHKPHFNRDFV